MQNWSKITDAMEQVDILLFDQFSNHCLANFIEPLRAANGFLRRKSYSWRFVTLDGAPVQSSSGLQIAPHMPLADAIGTALFLMPSYGVHALDDPTVIRAISRAARRVSVIGGCDTGPWLLGRAGLLDGYRATLHWDLLDRFAEAFPEIDSCRARYIVDQNRITCSGAMAAFDLVTHLIAAAHGSAIAADVAQLFMSRDAVPALASAPAGRTVNRAVSLMQDNIENPLPIAEIARRSGCTQKTLERRMRAAMGQSPISVYRRQRLSVALRLVQSGDLPVTEIAGRCGYANASAMTRAFKAAYGQSPNAMRQSGL